MLSRPVGPDEIAIKQSGGLPCDETEKQSLVHVSKPLAAGSHGYRSMRWLRNSVWEARRAQVITASHTKYLISHPPEVQHMRRWNGPPSAVTALLTSHSSFGLRVRCPMSNASRSSGVIASAKFHAGTTPGKKKKIRHKWQATIKPYTQL